MTDRIDIFFVEVAQTTLRRMVCRDCGEDIDVDEFFRPTRSTEAADTQRRARAAEDPRRPRQPATDVEKDAMLAALKRKMGE